MEIFIIVSFSVLFMLMLFMTLLVIGIGVHAINTQKIHSAIMVLLSQIMGFSNQIRIKQEQIHGELNNINRLMMFGPQNGHVFGEFDEDGNDFLINEHGETPFSFGAIMEPNTQHILDQHLDKPPKGMLSLSEEELQQLVSLFETEISKLQEPDAQE